MAVSEFGIAHRCWLTPVIVKLQPSGAFFGVTVKRQGIIVKSEPLANSTCLREHRELLFHRDFADLISELHSFLLGIQEGMVYRKSEDGFNICVGQFQRRASVALQMFPY